MTDVPRFCSHCGAPAGGRFCAACGRPLGGAGGGLPSAKLVPFVVGGAALLVVFVLLVRRQPAPPAQAAALPGAPAAALEAAPPDLSAMTPRERFDRLYNRIMEASENADPATVAQFSPMALAAYDMLGAEADADARYHAAMIRLVGGDQPGALALADTILRTSPDHLLGLVIGGAVATERLDEKGLATSRRRFLAAWDAQQGAGHREYQDHRIILERFRAEALAAPPK